MTKKIDIRPMTPKELAKVYRVSVRTFRSWLVPFREELGDRIGHFYSVIQVTLIYKKLGIPGETEFESS